MLVLLALLSTRASGGVYYSKESALRLAFPQADSIQKVDVFLSADDAAEVERRARVDLATRLITMYVGRKAGVVIGYAFIETHTVRTYPETLLIVLGPDGRASGVRLLAFHEPLEYAPSERWLEQFKDQRLGDELSLRGEIAGITGATLTATAVTAGVRRVMAVYRTVVASQDSSGTKTTDSPNARAEGTGN